MRSITCAGSSYEIGLQHGEQAKSEIQGSLRFYRDLFQRKCGMQWEEVRQTAVRFVPYLETNWPWFLQEIRGISEGAGVDVESILALNVRTEIAYGMVNDGCTAVAWKKGSESFLAQNWDWAHEQKPNLLAIHIHQTDRPPSESQSHACKPSIHMITEAGIIGKIGLNSHGVGVTLNAITAHGVNFSALPCHLALRTVLDSFSAAEALTKLESNGVAAACHILIADGEVGGTGLECSAQDRIRLEKVPVRSKNGEAVYHTNHYIVPHHNSDTGDEITHILDLPDSVDRLVRVKELVEGVRGSPDTSVIEAILKDEKGYPSSICRKETEKSTTATLFSIVMDLKARVARVKVGRPVEVEALLELNP